MRGEEGYWQLTVNYSVNFVNFMTGAHNNTTEICGEMSEVRTILPTYNRSSDFSMYIADFLLDWLVK